MSDDWAEEVLSDAKDTGFLAIPDGTVARTVVEEVTDVERNGAKFYNLRYRIVEGEYKNRVIFQKLYLFNGYTPEYMEDGEKRISNDRMRLKTLYLRTGLGELKSCPSIEKVQELVDKIVTLHLAVFEAPAKGEYPARDYNWIKEYEAAEPYDKPKKASAAVMKKAKAESAPFAEDDIPF